jgi:hypothetical protein
MEAPQADCGVLVFVHVLGRAPVKMDFAALTLTVPDDDAVVWRYIKLLDVNPQLQYAHLTLIRIDQFSDKYEGSVPNANFMKYIDEARTAGQSRTRLMMRPKLAVEVLAAADARVKAVSKERNDRANALRALRRSVYVNSWHCGDESEAMWRLYCSHPGGVAISAKFGNLKAAIEKSTSPVTVGKVQYFNYLSDQFPDDNLAYAVVGKRHAFEHEKELRIFQIDQAAYDAAFSDPTSAIDGFPTTLSLKIDLDIIESVRTSPHDEMRYSRTTTEVVKLIAPTLADRTKESILRGEGWRG